MSDSGNCLYYLTFTQIYEEPSFVALLSCAPDLASSPNSASANALSKIQTEIDPSIANELKVDNIYLSYKNSDIEIFAGFKIADNGINHPVIIHKLRDQAHHLNSKQIITDFFVFDNHVMAALLSGSTLALEDNLWITSDLVLPYNSKIIFSKDQNIIACTPISAFKQINARGGCTSLNPDWQIEIPWRTITPQICNGALHAIIHTNKKQEHWVIYLNDGKLILRIDDTKGIICPEKQGRMYRGK